MRLALALLLASAPAWPQLTINTVDTAGLETPVAGVIDFGSAPVGDELRVRFRLRNVGPVAETLSMLKVTAGGFSIGGAAAWPYIISPGTNYDFHIRFVGVRADTHTAVLTVNTSTVDLKAIATPTTTISVDGKTVVSGSSVEFGTVERGQSKAKLLLIDNPGAETFRISTLSLESQHFRLEPAPQLPLDVPPGTSLQYSLVCAPARSGLLTATLNIEGRRFTLNALGTEPKPPRPLIRLQSASAASAQQVRFSIGLSETSRANITGKLTVTLQNGARDDMAVFTASGKPTLDFDVKEGDQQARFGSGSEAVLQTGTTAGTLTITADIAGYTDQATLVVAPAPVVLDSTRSVREGTNLVVTLNGYDNTRTLSALSFSFFDTKGNSLATIRLDGTADFQKFFKASTVGGLFSLKATFPVTGDVARIGSVTAEMTNSAGTTKSDTLRF